VFSDDSSSRSALDGCLREKLGSSAVIGVRTGYCSGGCVRFMEKLSHKVEVQVYRLSGMNPSFVVEKHWPRLEACFAMTLIFENPPIRSWQGSFSCRIAVAGYVGVRNVEKALRNMVSKSEG
jgi:hypothetical protein